MTRASRAMPSVLLARTILHERFSPAQRAGLGLCILAIIAIALN